MAQQKFGARQKFGFGAAVFAALFTSLGFAAPAQAADEPAAGVARHSVATPDAALADSYWTAERMRNALPGELLAARAAERGTASPAADVARGTHQRVGSRAAKARHDWDRDGDWDGDRDRGRRAEAAVAHIGKVFFSLDGSNYVCSGNAVASENGNTVATAGHCLNSGAGTFATNFVFVPAYEDGAAPYGMWAAESLHTTQQWNTSGDLTYDTGFAVVSELNGEDLAAVVGASGVEFNAPRGETYTAYGYPAAAPYDGNRLISCEGEAEDDPFNPQFESQGIPCTMTGGSSGGPWFLGDGPDGLQNSINSYGYLGQMTTMYGPYWGEVIETAYESAAAQ